MKTIEIKLRKDFLEGVGGPEEFGNAEN